MRRENLKLARVAAGLTALELGEQAGVREEKVYQVERGRYQPTKEEASRWAAVLQMKPEEAFPEIFSKECLPTVSAVRVTEKTTTQKEVLKAVAINKRGKADK